MCRKRQGREADAGTALQTIYFSIEDKQITRTGDETDFLAPMEDSGFVATGGAVDDFHVVVDELGSEISTRSEVDQSDLLFLRAKQEVAPVGVGLFIKAKEAKDSA